MLLDSACPTVDGLSLLAARNTTRNSDLPCMILTACDSLERRIAGLDAGADDYLLKPFAMLPGTCVNSTLPFYNVTHCVSN